MNLDRTDKLSVSNQRKIGTLSDGYRLTIELQLIYHREVTKITSHLRMLE